MGADLYIHSISNAARAKYDPMFDAAVKKRNQLHEQARVTFGFKAREAILKEAEKAQKEVTKYYNLTNGDGYFRDSYNDSSLFWMIGLSWWDLAQQGVIDDRGNISPENAYLLAQLVKELPYIKPIKADLFSDTNSVEEVQKYFDKKRRNFIKFLMTAYNLNESVYASV